MAHMMQAHVDSSFTGTAVELRDMDMPMKWAPTSADQARLRRYGKVSKLLDVARHGEVAGELVPGFQKPDDQHWIPVDFPGMFGRLFRHYVFGREFRVMARSASGEETVMDLVSGLRLPSTLRQGAEFGAEYGDAVYKVALEDVENADGDMEPRPVLKFVAPWYYFPELDPLDGERVRRVTLAWCLEKPENVTGNGDWIVLREEHEPGTVRWRANVWDGERLGPDLPEGVVRRILGDDEFQLEQETGINEIPVVHVGFSRQAGSHWGRSLLLRVQRIIMALENRLAQEDEVLEKHARPKLVVGPGVLDEAGRANLAAFDVIEVEPSVLEKAVRPEYLTWNMQVQGIQHMIEKLEEYLFMTTETSPASFGLERDGSQVESARALKFKAHRTVNAVNDYRDEWEPAVHAVLRIAQKIWNAALDKPLPTSPVQISWGDAIVEDDTQKIQDMATLKREGLVSRKRGLREVFELTEEEAEAEDQAILQDMVDEAASMGLASRSPGPGTGELGGEAASAPPTEGEEPPEGVTPAEEA